MVPVRVDALYVQGFEQPVVAQNADFSILPFLDKVAKVEVNGETPNISEAIVNQPFQNENLPLRHGVHLHWSLPDALTRGDHNLSFPRVPDRWLVTRRRNGAIEKQWIVESNYLYPPGVNKRGSKVSIPFGSARWIQNDQGEYQYSPDADEDRAQDARRADQPFRFMGRFMPVDAWEPSFQNTEYYPNLSAIGYGEPTFAAFYPNCFSVFGFHDKNPGDNLSEIVYEVAGWYSEEADDVVKNLPLFAEGDIVNASGFVLKLKNEADTISQFLKGQLRETTEELLAAHDESSAPSGELLKELIDDLNEILKGGLSIYDSTRFAGVLLNRETTHLLNQSPEGEDLICLNRLLMEDAYPEEIAKKFPNIDDEIINQNFNWKIEAIKERLNWAVPGTPIETPERTLCYSSVSFGADTLPEHSNKNPDVSITVAETPTEALSACIAQKLVDSGNEDQLNSVENPLKSIEDQLEAMQLAFQLDETKLDMVARFKELRHRNGFTDVDSGTVWVLGKDSDQPNEQSDQRQALESLPPQIALDLAEVNELQRQYDRERHKISMLRKQLFADWYKYMICVYPDRSAQDYPDPDLVKYFIETKLLNPLQSRIFRNGELGDIDKSNDRVIGINPAEGSDTASLANYLVTKINALISAIDDATVEFNQTHGTRAIFYLKQVPGPRYKRANDPVVLIEGDAVKPSMRHGADGTLQCHLISLPSMDKGAFGSIAEKISSLRANDPNSFAFNIQSEQPWNPFLMDWEAEVLPLAQRKTDLPLPRDHFDENMIIEHYAAPVLEPDLTLKPNKGKIRRGAKIYSGQNILTSEANRLLENAIVKRLVDDLEIFTDATKISSTADAVSGGYSNSNYTLARAYEELKALTSLSQSLNGFNEALLMHKQTMELEVEDPLGFDAYQQFSDGNVRTTMGDNIRIAPSPQDDFSPIRSGCLKLSRIRLVDTFGQTLSLSTDKIDTGYKLTEDSSNYLVRLTPRLMQPARLNFRWLRANDDTGKGEMQNHPATTPICGWLLTNKLDRSLGVYDAEGHALGYFKAGRWRQAIDSDRAKALEDIRNPYLKRVARFIESAILDDSNFLNHYINTIDDALDNIQPESASDIQSPTLLIGRPVAVVRASLNLELQGCPAINQDWNIFRQDIAKKTRSTNNFTKVKFPIRLGEYGQLNDGLVGYWVEQMDADDTIRFAPDAGDGKIKFYSPQSNYIDTDAIESRYESATDGPINLYQSIEDAPIRTTMLMDVRGSIHATIGILPNKTINIPRYIYEEALQNIEVSFLYAPLLTQLGRIQIALRPVADYDWSWVECAEIDESDNQTWSEFFPENRIEQATFVAEWEKLTGLDTGQALWQYMLQEDVNWLAVVDDDEDGTPDTGRAKIINKDERKVVTLSDARFIEIEAQIQQIFDLHSIGIDPVVNNATAVSPYEIREGWLKLRKKQTDTTLYT